MFGYVMFALTWFGIAQALRDVIVWSRLARWADLNRFWASALIAALSLGIGLWLLRQVLRELASDEAFISAAQKSLRSRAGSTQL